MKKLISVILSFSVIAAMFSGMSVVSSAREDGHSHTACAAEALPSQKDDTVTTAIYINPLYKDVISEEEIQSLQNALNMPPSETNAAASDYVSSIDAAGAIMRENMKNRVASFTIYYKTTVKPTQQLFYDIADVAFMHTGVPTEGDYLLWQYGGWSGKLSPSSRGNEYYCDVTFNLTYYTTRAQEAAVDTAIEKLLRSELANCRTDYEKVCAIYDYMCSNIVYDYKNLNDDTYKLKYTAYAALINKTSVCQGYALLFYRLALTLGVDARIITGIGNGGAHGWNIVKLRGKYYNLDSTWDAGVKSYSYFLKCNAHFTDHLRDAEYNTPEFNKEYPMATEDYTNTPCTGSHRQSDPVIENVTAASCTEDGSYETVIYCLDCGIEVRRTKVTVPGGHKWNKDEYRKNTSEETFIAKNAKVLVVDDNAVNLKVAAGIFSKYEINISVATCGADSIKKIEDEKYDLILMDMVMPDMSGGDVLKAIRAKEDNYYKEVPFIALTAQNGANVRGEMLELGFQEYLAKPIRKRYLEKCLLEFLPEELIEHVKIKESDDNKTNEKLSADQGQSPESGLNTDKGLMNIGFNKDAYAAILNTYYAEGVKYLDLLPNLLEAGEIQLFTTDVHGIKSSSASIGAMEVSALFKELEFAGKAGDVASINRKFNGYLDKFREILDEVKAYLIGIGKLSEVNAEDNLDDKEIEEMTADILQNLKAELDKMNLKVTDVLVPELASKNFGAQVNGQIKKLREAYDMFDFHQVKAILNEMMER